MAPDDARALKKLVDDYRRKSWNDEHISRVVRRIAKKYCNPHTPTDAEIDDFLRDMGLPVIC